MAENTYVPVAFNEGAPLDASQLMQMQSNINVAYANAAKLSNSTGTTTYTIKSDCGTQPVEGLNKNTNVRVTVPVPGFTKAAKVVATPMGNVRDKEQITIVINNMLDGSFDMNVVSSDPGRQKTSINWIISEKV